MSLDTSDAHAPVSSRGQVRVRGTQDIFTEPPPAEYDFLRKGQPAHNKISIRHPHNNDVLLTLFAWDHKNGAIHYGLVHTACAILADNRVDGFLSLSRDADAAAGRIDMKYDDLLPCRSNSAGYFFHVPGITNYPVVPSFGDWQFPDSLPDAWLPPLHVPDAEPAIVATTQSNLSASVRLRDRTCRLSNHSTATQTAHLCPDKDAEWYTRNDMHVWNQSQTYAGSAELTRDAANCVLLRSDLHKSFDDRSWVFFPKVPGSFVAHFLQLAPDQAALYHNATAHPLQCEPRLLYARFAWAILPSLSGYLTKHAARRVKVWDTTCDAWLEKTLAGDELRKLLAARSSRSQSPTKRARPPLEDEQEDHADLYSQKRTRTGDSPPLTDSSRPASVAGSNTAASDGSHNDHHPHVRTSADPPDQDMELEEDLALMKRLLPRLEHLQEDQKPQSWYPGCRRVNRLKSAWLRQDRELSLQPSSDRGLPPLVVAHDDYDLHHDSAEDVP